MMKAKVQRETASADGGPPRDRGPPRPCPSTDGMRELDRLGSDGAAGRAASPPSSAATDGDDGDSSDDRSDDSSDEEIAGGGRPIAAASARRRPRQRTYFLGETFDPRTDQLAMHAFRRTLYWLTYRNDLVVPLRPYAGATAQGIVGNLTHGGGLAGIIPAGGDGAGGGMRSDAGWGCMLRSAQMMMAEAVRRHYSPGGGGCAEEDRSTGRKGGKSYAPLHSGRAKGTIAHRSKEDGRWRRLNDKSRSNIEHHLQNWRQLEDPREVERIAKWFADFPNHPDDEREADFDEDEDDQFGRGGLNHHWYSLHQMVAAGLGLGVLPGEWYGPTTACHVLRELNEIHCSRRERLAERLRNAETRGDDGGSGGEAGSACDVFRVHVSTEGCIYLDAVSKLMTPNNDGCDDEESWVGVARDPPSPAQDDGIEDPLRSPPPSQRTNTMEGGDVDHQEWETSLLLLLPLRLGIHSISAEYGSALAELLSLPQSVGMLGGTPRHALWFYGADAVEPPRKDGDGAEGEEAIRGATWHGLDPHTVQTAPRGTRALLNAASANGEPPAHRWEVQLTDAYLRSLHFSATTSHPNHGRPIPLSALDPSCALGFYLRDGDDFVEFRHSLGKMGEERRRRNGPPEVVTVRDRTPDYEADVNAAMRGAMATGRAEDGAADDLDGFSMRSEEEHAGEEEEDDDDDFVLI